jgi:hypothetical protein
MRLFYPKMFILSLAYSNNKIIHVTAMVLYLTSICTVYCSMLSTAAIS